LTDDQKALFGKKEEVNEKARKLIERGLYYYDNKSFSLALESFKQAVEEDESYFRTHYYLGQTYHAMERWKEAVEEYQLALPEAEKFKRIKYSYQLFDKLPSKGYHCYVGVSKIICYWYEPEEKTTNWKCFDMLKGEMLFENRKRIGKGLVLPAEVEYFKYVFPHFSSSEWIDSLPVNKIYGVNWQGEMLWEFEDSTCNFSWAYADDGYGFVVDDKCENNYIFDRKGALLAKIKEADLEDTRYIKDSCYFSHNFSTNVLKSIDLRSRNKIDSIKLESHQHYLKYSLGNIVLIKNDITNEIEVHDSKNLKKKWDFVIPQLNESNCRRSENHLLCFAEDGNLYAFKLKKRFYSSRLDWKTYVGLPCTTTSFLASWDTILVATQDGRVYGFDEKNGNILWHLDVGKNIIQSLKWGWIHEDLLILNAETEIAVFDIISGQLKWSKQFQWGGYQFVKSKELILLQTGKNMLSALSLKDGTNIFNYRLSRSRFFNVDEQIYLIDDYNTVLKELNLELYRGSGLLREDEVLKNMGVCYFELQDFDKADSIFSYVTNDLGMEDPDCYYYLYLTVKKTKNRELVFSYLRDYYDLIKDTQRGERAKKLFRDDLGVFIINNTNLSLSAWGFGRSYSTDSLIFILNCPGANDLAYSFGTSRWGYSRLSSEYRKITLNALDRNTGLTVLNMVLPGVVPYGILPQNLFLYEDHHYDQFHIKADFSVITADLNKKGEIWEKRLVEGGKTTTYFSILKADSNYIWTYCDPNFWSSPKGSERDSSNKEFQFWLLKTASGEILKEKKILLPKDYSFVITDGVYLLTVAPKNIQIFNAMTFEPIGSIETAYSIIAVSCDKETVYIGTNELSYSAYDIRTKKLIWQFKLPFVLNDYLPGISYLENNSFLDWNPGNLFCIETRESVPTNRRVRWRFQIESVCPDAQITEKWHSDKDKLYVRIKNCKEYSYIILDRETGNFLKGVKLPWIDLSGSQVIVSDNTIYCLTGDGLFYKMECFK
jgi:outer membrane protein assembly factor BamB